MLPLCLPSRMVASRWSGEAHSVPARLEVLLTPELPAVTCAQPQPDEMAVALGVVVVFVGRAPVNDDAIVEELDLAALEPEVEPVLRVAEELVHEPDGFPAEGIQH